MRPYVLASIAAILIATSGCNSEAKKQEFFEQGKRLAAEKRYVEAILQFRSALQIDDKFADARVHLAEVLAQSGNAEGAYREYQRAADLLPNDPKVQRRAVTLLFMAGQFKDVRDRAQAMLKKDPKDLEAQLLYANALVGLQDMEGGVKQIEDAIEMDPSNATAYTNLALLKMATGERGPAEDAFKKGVELDPKSLKARLALTYFYLSSGNVPLAEQSLTQALLLSPRDPLANRTLATLYLGTGRAVQAEKPLIIVAEETKTTRAKLALADYYIRLNRLKEATAVLEPMSRKGQTQADAQTRLADISYRSGARDLANKQLDSVIDRFKNHAGAQLLKARWLLADGRPAGALERATAAVNAAPGDPVSMYFRGTLQALVGQRDGAIKTFNDILRLNPRAVAPQVQLSQLSLKAGDTETAVGMAREAVANNPSRPEARIVLARALLAQRDFSHAEPEIARLLALYPNVAPVQALKGTLELLKGDVVAARRGFQAAFDADPTSISALSGLTMLDVQQKKMADARARIEKQMAAQPKRTELLIVAARLYVADNNLRKAEQLLRQVLDADPLRPEPYVILTELYRSQQRVDAARREFDAVVERKGGDIGARTMAAMLTHADGKLEDAKQRYEAVLQRNPRAAVAANNLAWIYADERQNLDVALDLAERATEQIPDYAEAWDTLGWVYQRKQLPFLAVAPFEAAVAKDPANATFHFHLGLALSGTGDRERARESLQTALKLQPNFHDAQRELKALAQ